MDYRPFLPRQAASCVVCPSPLPCSCQPNEQCIRINRDCLKCDENKCVPIADQTTPTKGGVSKGALAGGIVGVLLFFALALALFFAYRRKIRARKARVRHSVKDTPAPAEMVLNRPDPMEKSPSELSTLNQVPVAPLSSPQPHSVLNSPMNPFDDVNSIQTAVTEGTNVIPIALVSPESETSPARPVRTPEVGLNLEHLNVSHDNVRAGAGSMRSGFSGISRNSYMSSASYGSEFLNEAPMIMTPTQGAVRQVLGVVKAEVINTATSDTLKPPSSRKPASRSPLASTSFGMNQTLENGGDQPNDPFADENMSNQATYGVSPAPTATTFDASQDHRESGQSTLVPDMPDIPSISWNDHNRPASLSTQAGSVIGIASATRVNLGLKSPGTAGSLRTTVGRLVSPTTGASVLQDQQRRALEAQGMQIRRVSGSSVLSATSTRADSILESFPFVPPSPISDRPIRSPPVSPLAKQSFTASGTSSLSNTLTPPSPMTHQPFSLDTGKTIVSEGVVDDDPLPAPPNRRMLGLSTGSNLSTASSGLGSFPFQIESESSSTETPMASYTGIKRASLDTLALTNDLSSYPLSFDRSGFQIPEK